MYCLLVLTLTGFTVADFLEEDRGTGAAEILRERVDKLETLLLMLISEDRDRVDKLETLLLKLQSENQGLADKVSLLESNVFMLKAENAKLRNQAYQRTTDSPKQKDSVVGGDRPRLKYSVAGGDHDVVARSDDTSPLEPVIAQMNQRLSEMSAKLDVLQNAKIQQDTAIQQAASSVYIRWGRSTCPNSAQLVYLGVVGGSKYQDTGAATNYLCLSLSPVFSDHPVPQYMAYLHGSEYHTFDNRHPKDPVCAVCRSQHPTVIMVPGTNVCMSGWVQEYGGFLMAGDPIDPAGSEYICVDSALEDRIGTDAVTNGKLLYYTVTRCGGLPCSPYVNNTVVTCTVCSK